MSLHSCDNLGVAMGNVFHKKRRATEELIAWMLQMKKDVPTGIFLLISISDKFPN